MALVALTGAETANAEADFLGDDLVTGLLLVGNGLFDGLGVPALQLAHAAFILLQISGVGADRLLMGLDGFFLLLLQILDLLIQLSDEPNGVLQLHGLCRFLRKAGWRV